MYTTMANANIAQMGERERKKKLENEIVYIENQKRKTFEKGAFT